jgi:hypothetical protein
MIDWSSLTIHFLECVPLHAEVDVASTFLSVAQAPKFICLTYSSLLRIRLLDD